MEVISSPFLIMGNVMYKGIIREDKKCVSTIFFNRPEKRNSLNADALFAFGDTIRAIEKDDNIRVIVLRGSGEKVFSSGVDLSDGPKEFTRTIEGLEYSINSLMHYPLPVISMVFGPAIGAGLDFAVISDFRIASDNAKFGAPLVKIGRTYYYTAIERLTRLTGLAAAKEMLLTGRLIDAVRAVETGLAHRIVSPDKLEAVTYELADEMAVGAAPMAVKVTKHTIKKLFEESRLDPALEKELHGLVEKINDSSDAREGVRAMLEKRKPVFTGK